MALNANKVPMNRPARSKEDYLESGSYPARLVAVTTLGVQDQDDFKGQPKAPTLEIQLTYELLDEFLIDRETGEILEDKPKWISETMPFRNLVVDKATSTKRYLSLDPEQEHDGDWSRLLGTPCIVTIVLESWTDKITKQPRYKNKIDSISPMRPKEAAKAEPLKNEPRIFDFDNPDMSVWPKIPAWLQDKMKSANNFEGSPLDHALRSYTPPAKADSEVSATPTPEKKTRASKPAVKAAEAVVVDDGDEDW